MSVSKLYRHALRMMVCLCMTVLFQPTIQGQNCGVIQDELFVDLAAGGSVWSINPGNSVKGDTVMMTTQWSGVSQRISALQPGDRIRLSAQFTSMSTERGFSQVSFRDAAGDAISRLQGTIEVDSQHLYHVLRGVVPDGTVYTDVFFAPGAQPATPDTLRLTYPCLTYYRPANFCGVLADRTFSQPEAGDNRGSWHHYSGVSFDGGTATFSAPYAHIWQAFKDVTPGQVVGLTWEDSLATGQDFSMQVVYYDVDHSQVSRQYYRGEGTGSWANRRYAIEVPADAHFGTVQLDVRGVASDSTYMRARNICMTEQVYGTIKKYTTLAHLNQEVETTNVGLRGSTGSYTHTLNSPSSTRAADVYIYFAGSRPGDSEEVTVNVDGTPRQLSRRVIRQGTTSPAAVYEGSFAGPVTTIEYPNTLATGGLAGLSVVEHRDGNATLSEGALVHGEYRTTGSASPVRISLAPSFSTRDLEISVPLGLLRNDGSAIEMDYWINAGDVKTASVSFGGSGQVISAGGLGVLKVTLPDVPANRTFVFVRMRSPAGGQPLFLMGPIQATNLTTSQIVVEGVGSCTGSLGAEMFPEGDFGTVDEFGGETGLAPFTNITWGPEPGGVVAPGYDYVKGVSVNDGSYAIVTTNEGIFQTSGGSSRDSWIVSEDYGPEDDGYAMLVNADIEPGIFFLKRIRDLCFNTKYTFTVAIKNVDNPIFQPNNPSPPGPPFTEVRILPDIDFVLAPVGSSSFDLETIPASHSSGPIMNDGQWHIKGFSFTLPPGIDDVMLAIRNNAPGGEGNDILLDNISFRPCGPLTVLADTRPWCDGGGEVRLDGALSGTYPAAVWQWERSNDNAQSWSPVAGATTPNLAPGLVPAGTLYRLRTAGSTASLNEDNCAVLSDNYAVPNGDCFEDCGNGTDDDLDGLIDCDDPDCSSVGACPCSTGYVDVHYWREVYGSGLTSLYSDPRYPNSPDIRLHSALTDMPNNVGDNYGVSMSGWIVPNTTGNYEFNITGDNQGSFKLSPNSGKSDMVEVAALPAWGSPTDHYKYPDQTSAPITLAAGSQYYFDAVVKEAYGGDHLQLYWRDNPSAAWTILYGSVLQTATTGCRIENCTNGVDDDGDGLIDGCDPECPSEVPASRVTR